MTEVVVTAPARLHFGILDPVLDPTRPRRFGGFGVGIESPRVVAAIRRVDAEAADAVLVSGPQSDRAAAFARRARSQLRLDSAIAVDVREAIPSHCGLGSGTRLGLAIARGVAELAAVPAGPEELAAACGRGARSSVGCWTFAGPGLVVEAGVRDDEPLSPLLGRYPMPERWRCVLALPVGAEGLSGDAEERFFGGLRDPAGVESEVARLLVTAVLPGLLRADIAEFGAALTRIQRDIGSMFAAQQGGVFHPRAAPLVDTLLELGVPAVGQSSWGPAAYGIVDGPEVAADVAGRLRAAAGADAGVSVVDFDRRGAWVFTP